MAKLLLIDRDNITTSSSFNYIVNIFKNDIEEYIRKLTRNNIPRLIVVCMVYFPCLYGEGWADMALKLMDYTNNPELAQNLIKHIYLAATSQIQVDGIEIKSVPLYEILDPECGNDYISRVEPSSTGGKKIAKRLIEEF